MVSQLRLNEMGGAVSCQWSKMDENALFGSELLRLILHATLSLSLSLSQALLTPLSLLQFIFGSILLSIQTYLIAGSLRSSQRCEVWLVGQFTHLGRSLSFTPGRR
uniref:Uncharacterized protein n=1 Tax=Nelumbo nucifera TaxID=4432 RepID=A0A822YT92_NELNU|nr:TPA_asm: hypothetical protein HUJ06_005963 [Nelumbo nucifera]